LYKALTLLTDIFVVKDCNVFIFKDEGVFMDPSFMKMKAVCSFETLEIRNPATEGKKPEDQNPHCHHLGNPKSRK
jgi:hypothetical protein